MKPSTRYTVFAIKANRKTAETVWVRAGVAWVNKDDSMNVYLDVLPLEGQLHVRETGPERNTKPEHDGQANEGRLPKAVYSSLRHTTEDPTAHCTECDGNGYHEADCLARPKEQL